MRVDYEATEDVREAVATLQRTEDLKFSPDNRRLAIAGYAANKIVIFDIRIAASPNGPNIALTGFTEISSPHLNHPHGLDFFDDETIIVANRYGNAPIFRLPSDASKAACTSWCPSGSFVPATA
jgi:hypothetical protein